MIEAISGIQAAFVRMAVSAHNVANINTEGFRASRVFQRERIGGGTEAYVRQTDAPTDYATEAVEQIVSKHMVKANAAVIRTHDQMIGSLVNILA